MTIILDLPPDVEAELRSDAQAQGRDASSVAAERLAELYARIAEGRAQRRALLTDPAHPSDLEAMCAKYGLPVLHTEEEIAAAAEEAIAELTPAQRADAERLCLA